LISQTPASFKGNFFLFLSPKSFRRIEMPPVRKYAKTAGTRSEEYEAAMEEAEELQNEIRQELDGAYDDFRRVEKRLSTLPDRLVSIRKRGYNFMPELEPDLSTLAERWEGIRPRVIREFEKFTLHRGFDSDMSFLIDAGFFGYDRFGLHQLRDAKQRASLLNSKIDTLLSPVSAPLSHLTYMVDHVNRMLTDMKAATFKLCKGEKPGWFEMNDIIWGGKKRKCNIYFTSHRVIFEERSSGIISKKKRKTIYAYPMADVDGFDMERGFLGIGDKVTMKFVGGDAVMVKVGNPDKWISRVQPFTNQEFYLKVHTGGKAATAKAVKAGARYSSADARKIEKLRTLLDKLDEQLALGKISEKTYMELRTKYESQLSRLV